MPVPLTHAQQILALAQRHHLLRARDVVNAGLPSSHLTRLVVSGRLERVARGLYGLPDRPAHALQSLAEVALRVPHGVVCLVSALRVHELGTQAPSAVWLALPPRRPRPHLRHLDLRVVRMSDATRRIGVVHVDVHGVAVPVFDVAKTVADCFKYRHRIGLDVALEAFREAWFHRRLCMDDLWRYATLNRVHQVMRPYVEGMAA